VSLMFPSFPATSQREEGPMMPAVTLVGVAVSPCRRHVFYEGAESTV
jgi:hypothetical protein